jgi:hypothetical protein
MKRSPDVFDLFRTVVLWLGMAILGARARLGLAHPQRWLAFPQVHLAERQIRQPIQTSE